MRENEGMAADIGGQLPQDAAKQAAQRGERPKARDLNELIRYTMWSVFRLRDSAARDEGWSGAAGQGRDRFAAELDDLLEQAAGKGVVTRGCYDVQGLRADADYMFWWIARSPDDLQEMYARFRRTSLGRISEPVWSVMALHRPAEFNKSHVPAFLAGEEPRGFVCVYPFVRSYEWYLLDDSERRAMLAEHGMMAREYPDVRANTVSCFALNDYEWMLGFEADVWHRVVVLIRKLGRARARPPGPAAPRGGNPVQPRRAQAGSRAARRAAVTALILSTALRRVLFCRQRFTAELARGDLAPLLAGWEIAACPPGKVADHLDGIDAVCPFGAPIDAAVLAAGGWRLRPRPPVRGWPGEGRRCPGDRARGVGVPCSR